MSALEIPVLPELARPRRLHLVEEGEVPASVARKAHARMVARARTKGYAALGSLLATFVAAWVTIGWAFLAIPNTPLP